MGKIKLLINRKNLGDIPYGGGQKFVSAAFKYFPMFDIECTNILDESVGAILMIDPRYDETGISIKEIHNFKRTFPQTKIFHRVNECDAKNFGSNNLDPMLLFASTFTDTSIFVSKWCKNYHLAKGWRSKNNHVILNGCDETSFKPNKKLDNGKINIVVSHWSDNPNKGKYYYEFIDEFVGKHSDFTFTYIGRHKCSFKNTNVIPPLTGKELGIELGKYDIFINASMYDPAPNSVFEPIACGLPTYVHSEGGGGVELAGEDHVFRNIKELEEILLSKNYINNAFSPSSWQECIKKYSALIKSD